MVTLGSLCSGVGALDLAVATHYDATLTYVADNDPAASEVLAHRFPDVANLGDIRTIDPLSAQADIVTAGFPCGPVAPIGKQLGTADPRWLCDDIVELLAALPTLPKVVVFENVVGLLSNNSGRTAREFFGAVAQLGFNLRWGVVQARDAQAPHRRSRVFAVATNAQCGQLQRPGDPGQLARSSTTEHRPGLASVLASPLHRSTSPRRSHTYDFDKFEPVVAAWEKVTGHPAPPPLLDGRLNARFAEWMVLPTGWVTDVIGDRDDRFRLIGNSVVPRQALLALGQLDHRLPKGANHDSTSARQGPKV